MGIAFDDFVRCVGWKSGFTASRISNAS